jgi:hypothetical protein
MDFIGLIFRILGMKIPKILKINPIKSIEILINPNS